MAQLRKWLVLTEKGGEQAERTLSSTYERAVHRSPGSSGPVDKRDSFYRCSAALQTIVVTTALLKIRRRSLMKRSISQALCALTPDRQCQEGYNECDTVSGAMSVQELIEIQLHGDAVARAVTIRTFHRPASELASKDVTPRRSLRSLHRRPPNPRFLRSSQRKPRS